jgi:hypothetical protein
MYPVRFRVDEGNFTNRLAEIRDWLNQRRIDPSALHYHLAADHVRLRIEFMKPSEAAAFQKAFADSPEPGRDSSRPDRSFKLRRA